MFRQEVIDARKQGGLGEISLAVPLSCRIFGALSCAFLCVLAGIFVFGHYTDREPVKGQLVPRTGLLKVTSAVQGRVTHLYVELGQTVEAGAPLVEVSSELDSATLGGTHTRINEGLQQQKTQLLVSLDAQRHLFAGQADDEATRQSLLREQVATLDAQTALAQHDAQASQDILEKTRPLAEKGYISSLQVRQQESAALQGWSQIESLQRQRLDVRQQLRESEARQKQRPLDKTQKESDFQRQLAEIDQRIAQNEQDRAVVIRAPANGAVTSLPARLGQVVSTSEILMTVLPDHSGLLAEMLVPARAVGFVRVGDHVVLRYDAYPYQKYGSQSGTVSDVAATALTREELQARSSAAQDESMYRIAVTLDHESMDVDGISLGLKPGMSFEADILKDRRSLLEWVLSPVHGFQSRTTQG